jgi:hypothetical protein
MSKPRHRKPRTRSMLKWSIIWCERRLNSVSADVTWLLSCEGTKLESSRPLVREYLLLSLRLDRLLKAQRESGMGLTVRSMARAAWLELPYSFVTDWYKEA